eukprot:6463830-Pyramimonas_sp.AAC.1
MEQWRISSSAFASVCVCRVLMRAMTLVAIPEYSWCLCCKVSQGNGELGNPHQKRVGVLLLLLLDSAMFLSSQLYTLILPPR